MAEYAIGYLGMVNHFLGFQETMSLSVALKIFNNKSHPLTQEIFPGIDFTISMAIMNDQGDELIGMDEAFKLMESGLYNHYAPTLPMEPVLGLIGPRLSNVAKPVSLFSSVLNIPMLSHAANSPDLSDKDQYPSFCRMVPSADVGSKIMGDYIKHFGWTQIAILTCDQDDCIDYTDAMLKQKDTYGYEVPVVSSITSSDSDLVGGVSEETIEATTNDLENALTLIQENNIRVIVLAETGDVHILRHLYKVMKRMGMYSEDIDHGHVVITRQGSNAMPSNIFGDVDDEEHRSGQLTLRYKWPSETNRVYKEGLFGEWDGTITSLLGATAPLADSVGAWMGWSFAGKDIAGETSIPMAFDAVMVYFQAIYDLEMSGTEVTRENLMDAIPNVEVKGATGMIQFDENCDRGVEFELINLRDDLPINSKSSDVVETHDWHPVATWTPPSSGEAFGTIVLDANNSINWGTGLENHGIAPPDYMVKPSENEDISKESLILIAIGSVGGVLAIGFFARYIKKHCAAQEGAERFDANREQQRRVMWSILKSIFAFALEIGDYVTDALSASSVFALMGEDVISPIFVVLYLCIICIGGVANFGNCIARTKNFIDLIKEYTHGVSMTTSAGHEDEHDDGSTATPLEVKLLKEQGLHDDVEKLEAISVKMVEVRRSIRIEKFTFILGFVEDLPITILNSILLIQYRDDIEYGVIYFSTLLTLLEFGMKSMSLEKIFMLNSELNYLKTHSQLQRNHSINKANKQKNPQWRNPRASYNYANESAPPDHANTSTAPPDYANASSIYQ